MRLLLDSESHHGNLATGRFLHIGEIQSMGTQAQPFHQDRIALPLGQPWASRLIATLGIVIMMVGLYVPCAGREVGFHSDPVTVIRDAETWTITTALWVAIPHAHRLPLPLNLGIEAAFSALILGGLALIPLLWRPLSLKDTVLARWMYAVWLLLLTLLVAAALVAWGQLLSRQPSVSPSETVTFGALYLLPGALVFPLGVALNCAALTLMFREPLPAAALAPAPRTGRWWAARRALTVGALVWGIGFYLMPEATTAACPPIVFSLTQFAHSACAGLDSDQVLATAYTAGLNPAALFLDAVGRNYELLVAAGCITMLGWWTRQLSVKTLAWLAAWQDLALGVALVALQGVDVIARRGFQLTAATGAGWHMASGIVGTFVGIGRVALGQIGLWREMKTQRHGERGAP
jgi:hypothetical protein